MTQSNYSVVTNYGRAWNARAAAGEAVSPITAMVFGDGDRAPTGGETEILNEVYRQTISGQGSYEDQSAAWFDAYLEADIGGFVIREHGLLTADGNLVAIGVRNPGIPKAHPSTGAADDFTYRIDIFFSQIEALVVEVDPIHGLTSERRIDTGDGILGGGGLGQNRTFTLDRKTLLCPKTQKLVLTSDHQPDINAAHGAAQAALAAGLIDSIATNHADADFVIFSGDIADWGQPSDAEIAGNAEPYISLQDQRKNLEQLPCGMNNIFTITGNHEINRNSPESHAEGATFLEYLRRFPAATYHVEIGNIIIIFMGDEAKGTPGTISEETFHWWEDIVVNNQDNFIITVTHQSLAGTINADTASDSAFINTSQLFIDAMTRAENPAKSNLWICGHHGSYSTSQLDNRTVVAHGGCQFVQCGAHVPSLLEAGSARPAVYWTMHWEDGSNSVKLRHWDHSLNGYIDANEIEVISHTPLRLRSMPQFDGRYMRHPRFDRQGYADLAQTAHLTVQQARQEIRLRILEGTPTANMETAL